MHKTIQSIIKSSSKILKLNGVQRARHESIIIVKNVLSKSYVDILTNGDREITLSQTKHIFSKVKQRTEGKPLSKIFGCKEFYSRNFFTSKHTLDPRPETELIVDVAKSFIQHSKKKNIKLLDLGTGSGCIIITLYLELYYLTKNLNFYGSDISKKALDVAKTNLKKFNLINKIRLIESNWFEKVNEKFDIIISNPPYIKKKEIRLLSKDILFDPIKSLDGGISGLKSYKKIASLTNLFLKKNGLVILEIGKDQLKSVEKIFFEKGFYRILKEKDLQCIDRIVVFKYKD